MLRATPRPTTRFLLQVNMWLHTSQSAGELSSSSSSPSFIPLQAAASPSSSSSPSFIPLQAAVSPSSSRFIRAVPTALGFGATPGGSQSDSSSHEAHLQDAASPASGQLPSDRSSGNGDGREPQPRIVSDSAFEPSAPHRLQPLLHLPLLTGNLHGSPDRMAEGSQLAQQLSRRSGRGQDVQEAQKRRWVQPSRAPHPAGGAPASAARLESWTTYSDGDGSEKGLSLHSGPANSTPPAAPAPEQNAETRSVQRAEVGSSAAVAAAAQLWGRQPVQRMQFAAGASAPSALDRLPQSQVQGVRQPSTYCHPPSRRVVTHIVCTSAASRCYGRQIRACMHL